MRRLSLYIILILFSFISCHSSKKVVSNKDLKQFKMVALYDTITRSYGDYQTVKLNFSVDSKDMKLPIQLKGSMRIKKDSAIWISIAPSKIEVLRCMITQDSIKAYSKLQKTFLGCSLDSLSQNIGLSVDYQTIQAILLNELFFCQQEQNIDTLNVFKNLEINKKDNKLILKTHSKKEFKKTDTLSLLQTWQIANENYRISEVEIIDEDAIEGNENVIIKLMYSDFEQFDKISFPIGLNLKIKLPNTKIHGELKYSKVSFNEDLSFPFNPGSKYQKMELKN